MGEVDRAEIAVETNKAGKTIINGVEVEDFNLFADTPHPSLPGVTVVTGIRYRPADYPERYETAWCYFSVWKNGTEIKFDLGNKAPGEPPRPRASTSSARNAAGIAISDHQAGITACQWPTP
ncbi:MAG: hypothetical protein AAFU49_12910 [Pseudomonadota bacterium]